MKIVIIVQARMTSTRLPGKILKQVLGKPLLEYEVDRLRLTKADAVVIATTKQPTDDPVVTWCEQHDVLYYRGSEEDVLSRYAEAAAQYAADVIVRVTSDCPLADPEVINRGITEYLDHYPHYDYVTNTLERTYPRGLDVEIFSRSQIDHIAREAKEPHCREHVTPYLYQNPKTFHLHNFSQEPSQAHHRWTVDTAEDFELIRHILEELYPKKPRFSQEDVLQLLQHHPEWIQMNAHIEQKKIVGSQP